MNAKEEKRNDSDSGVNFNGVPAINGSCELLLFSSD